MTSYAYCPECAETLKHPGQNHAWTVAGYCAIAGCTANRAHTHAAQPDRPEPVDPSEVRVGDVVEIEADDGSWMVRGRVGDIDDTIGESYLPICIEHPNGEIIWIDARESGAIVRILRRTEPEPDPAAVQALAPTLYGSMVRLSGEDYVDWEDAETDIRGLYLDEARTLIRDHGVHVEVPR